MDEDEYDQILTHLYNISSNKDSRRGADVRCGDESAVMDWNVWMRRIRQAKGLSGAWK